MPKIGYFPGAWDLLHVGHIRALEEAKQHCDYLIVGLGECPHVGNLHKHIPILSLQERYELLRANKFIDAIVVYKSEYDSIALDTWFPYDVRFMGSDHKHNRKNHEKRIKKKIIYLSRNHNYSSSELRKRIHAMPSL